jgi:poly-gamma-glutamate synthesis protein (capsule biosynthesis protein)
MRSLLRAFLRTFLLICMMGATAFGGLQAQERLVTLAIAGDLMLAGKPERAMRAGRDPFAGVAHLFQDADIRLANMECVVATGGSFEPDKPNTFRVHPNSLKFVRRHLDAVGLANNHSADFGPQAFVEMLSHLERAGIATYGGGRDLKSAHTPLVLERHGLRIAWLGYNEFQPRSFEADHDRAGIAWSEDEQVVRDIVDARRIWRADVVIPVMHWGWEEATANARQRELARLMVDAGADAVIGGHPHQIQDMETYKGKPIIYSLGNFVFEGFDDPVNNKGWVVRLRLNRQGVQSWQTHTVLIDGQGLPQAAQINTSQRAIR